MTCAIFALALLLWLPTGGPVALARREPRPPARAIVSHDAMTWRVDESRRWMGSFLGCSVGLASLGIAATGVAGVFASLGLAGTGPAVGLGVASMLPAQALLWLLPRQWAEIRADAAGLRVTRPWPFASHHRAWSQIQEIGLEGLVLTVRSVAGEVRIAGRNALPQEIERVAREIEGARASARPALAADPVPEELHRFLR